MKFLAIFCLMFVTNAVNSQNSGLSLWLDSLLNFRIRKNVVSFLLYTRDNPDSGQKITADTSQIETTFFKTSNPLRLLVHGWLCEGNSPVTRRISEGYLKNGNFNVIVVDWGNQANHPNYFHSRSKVLEISSVVADLLNFLLQSGLTTLNETVIVGHSLGAHIAGLAARKVRGGKISAIIGLDPAGILYSYKKTEERLVKTDASYVEVVHTSSLGFREPLGHTDFYPNYGTLQPGCSQDLECCHSRSWELFAESLNNNGFCAIGCQNFQEVDKKKCSILDSGFKMGGEPLNSDQSGIFYLATNPSSPFAQL